MRNTHRFLHANNTEIQEYINYTKCLFKFVKEEKLIHIHL